MSYSHQSVSVIVSIRFLPHPFPVPLHNMLYHKAWLFTRDLSSEWLSGLFHCWEVAVSLTSSQNYRQEIESRIGARGCVCVLWRQQVGLWIPYPARRHEAHAQEASPAKYSWPPSRHSLPLFIYRSAAHWEPNREQTVKVASFFRPLC